VPLNPRNAKYPPAICLVTVIIWSTWGAVENYLESDGWKLVLACSLAITVRTSDCHYDSNFGYSEYGFICFFLDKNLGFNLHTWKLVGDTIGLEKDRRKCLSCFFPIFQNPRCVIDIESFVLAKQIFFNGFEDL
jgi:hypothetical protein